jgi:hypothetical protein
MTKTVGEKRDSRLALRSNNMAVKAFDWDVSDLGVEPLDGSDLLGVGGPDEWESDLEDGAEAIWPSGGLSEDDPPPAPGRCRRVPHDW